MWLPCPPRYAALPVPYVLYPFVCYCTHSEHNEVHFQEEREWLFGLICLSKHDDDLLLVNVCESNFISHGRYLKTDLRTNVRRERYGT